MAAGIASAAPMLSHLANMQVVSQAVHNAPVYTTSPQHSEDVFDNHGTRTRARSRERSLDPGPRAVLARTPRSPYHSAMRWVERASVNIHLGPPGYITWSESWRDLDLP